MSTLFERAPDAPGSGDPLAAIRTPRSAGGLLQGPAFLSLLSRLAGRLLRRPLRVGGRVVVARHADVEAVLERDLEFLIAPINAARIEAVNGPFVLGMDRSERLGRERHALYAALDAVDIPAIVERGAEDADALIASAVDGQIDVAGGYARIVAGRTAARLFGVSGPDEATFLEVARAVFAHTFLNIGGDKVVERRALKAAELMRAWLAGEIARRRGQGLTGEDMMGALMRRPELDDDGVRRTLGGMLVGAVDTTSAAVTRIVHVLGRDRALLDQVCADADAARPLAGWCWEALRRWPHNPLVLRQAAADAVLNGVAIPAGAQVFAWTAAAMQDPQAFPEPDRMRPDRPAGAYLHLGGGLHPCAGRAVNGLQIPMLVGKLLARGIAGVGAVAWAGPFPDHLELRLEPR